MSVNHYENFPVGSLVLPRRLRKPVHAVYAFARTADDIADEGDAADEVRLQGLNDLQKELDTISRGETPQTALMQRLQREAVRPFQIPLQPFYDLLDAFKQDVVKKRYENFGELVDYCRKSANPVGRMMLHLYGETDSRSIAQSDGICTALQLINFWQDVAVDWQKGRVYLPQEDLRKFGVSEAQIGESRVDFAFQRLMAYECEKAHKMLKAGSPLGKTLKGRVGLELRMIILGGQRIIQKLEENKYDVFAQRPKLEMKDWWKIVKRALQKK
ncbi:squalene synthase HpnC [Uruburuella testudinis]|uniref:Squalene synthase HpnC n=1 Tax=Uruburuella testudinis TaxID=1282863 RepID=A0ABY4DTE5_9NEIS|nr:squalene synthase HpnC [Uruburuella testudinis]UOO82321.1 squalene synthase HpnC [Uruburuella testudinis]